MKAPSIEELNAFHLQTPLCNMLGLNTVKILDWQKKEMKSGAGNPVTIGLYLFQGRVHVNDKVKEFSMVLKVIQSPANIGLIEMGGEDDQKHWNYWQREPLFYQSDLLKQMPDCISRPECYGIQTWDGSIIWLWLEDIEYDRYEIRQPEELVILAYKLGRFNGRFSSFEGLFDIPWLGRDTHGQWLKPIKGFTNPLFTSSNHPDWNNPVMKSLFPSDSPNPYRQVRDSVNHYLEILDTLQTTWCHGDSDPSNFKIRKSDVGTNKVVALDWALTCLGVLGQDLAHLIFGSFDWFDVFERDDVIQMIVNSYLDGLRETGWHGNENTVLLGYGITVLIKYGTYLLFTIGRSLLDVHEVFSVTKKQISSIQFLQQTAQLILEIDNTRG